MTRPASNVGHCPNPVYESRAEMFAAFDQLPARLRALLAAAPYNYAAVPHLERYHAVCAHASTEQIAHDWARRFAKMRAEEALELYGPDHPQAAA